MEQTSKNLWGIIIAAIIAAASLGLIFWKFDPYASGWFLFVLLFLSFFMLTSSVAVLGVYYYKQSRGIEDITRLFPLAVRTGLTISVVVTSLFVLQALHLLAWWNSLLLITIAGILDMYFKK